MAKTAENTTIGALYLGETQFGNKPYMSGNITVEGITIPIVIFKNERKRQNTHPDFYIYKARKPAPERAAPAERFEPPKNNDNS